MVGLLTVVACAGTKLHEVGDLDGEGGAGQGGEASTPADGGNNDFGDGGELPVMGGSGGKSPVVGGSGGTTLIDEPPIVGGAGGAAPDEFVCEACELVAETPDIRDVWAGSEHLYWIEYGGFDELENHLDNGRLMSMPLAGGEPVEVASDLQGPVQLAVSEGHAYVLVERSSSLEGARQLVRVALETGDEQVLQAFPDGFNMFYDRRDWARRFFAVGGGYAFWLRGATIYRLSEDATSAPEALLETESLVRLLADESALYLLDAQGIASVSFGGEAGAQLWTGEGERFETLTLAAGNFYALEVGATAYLARLPGAGGSFKRFAEAPAPWLNRLNTDGARFVGDFGVRLQPEANASSALWEGEFSAVDTARMVARAPMWDDGSSPHGPTQIQWRAWDATPTAIYLGYGDQLYSVEREF